MSAGTRFPNRSEDELSPEELETTQFLKVVLTHNPPPHEPIVSPEGRLLGHFNTFTYLPATVKPVLGAIQAIFTLPLPANAKEVAVFAVSALFKSPYQAYVHQVTAANYDSTLTEEQIATLAKGVRPADLHPEDAIVWEVVEELQGGDKLTDKTFAKSVKLLGKDETLNLILYVSMTVFLALVGKGADVGLPYDKKE